jgi:hypothetical protein
MLVALFVAFFGAHDARAQDDLVIEVKMFGACHLCAAYTVKISADGRVLFFGERQVKTEGSAKGKIERAAVNTLMQELESIKFFQLSDEYRNQFNPDSEWTQITARKNGITKTVRSNMGYGIPGSQLFMFTRNVQAAVDVKQWVCPAPLGHVTLCFESK